MSLPGLSISIQTLINNRSKLCQSCIFPQVVFGFAKKSVRPTITSTHRNLFWPLKRRKNFNLKEKVFKMIYKSWNEKKTDRIIKANNMRNWFRKWFVTSLGIEHSVLLGLRQNNVHKLLQRKHNLNMKQFRIRYLKQSLYFYLAELIAFYQFLQLFEVSTDA